MQGIKGTLSFTKYVKECIINMRCVKMKQILMTFVGYLLITIGLSIFYLTIFRRDRLPKIFSKMWFIIIVFIAAIACLIVGWLVID